MIAAEMNQNVVGALNHTIRAYIIENLFLGGVTDFDDDASLLESGALDSTGAMELVSFLEKRFGIVIKDQEINPENLETVNRISVMVEKKTALLIDR
jgi:acyl carrier protein